MLKDPRWDTPPPKPKPARRGWLANWLNPVTPHEAFDLQDFTAWVAAQPKDKTYPFEDPFGCANALYLQHRGVPWHLSSLILDIPGLSQALNHSDNTYGGLHLRLRLL